MSYRHSATRKMRRPRAMNQIVRLVERDTRFCDRHGIPEAEAWRWDRRSDHTIREAAEAWARQSRI